MEIYDNKGIENHLDVLNEIGSAYEKQWVRFLTINAECHSLLQKQGSKTGEALATEVISEWLHYCQY